MVCESPNSITIEEHNKDVREMTEILDVAASLYAGWFLWGAR